MMTGACNYHYYIIMMVLINKMGIKGGYFYDTFVFGVPNYSSYLMKTISKDILCII